VRWLWLWEECDRSEADVIGSDKVPDFPSLLSVKQQLHGLIRRIQQSLNNDPLNCDLASILHEHDRHQLVQVFINIKRNLETLRVITVLLISMHRLMRRLCAYRDAAEEGLSHLQQVGPALCHAHHNVRQCCSLRYARMAPARIALAHGLSGITA